MKLVGGAVNFVARPLKPEAQAVLDGLDAKLKALVQQAEQAADARHADRIPREDGTLFEDGALEQSYLDYLQKRRGG